MDRSTCGGRSQKGVYGGPVPGKYCFPPELADHGAVRKEAVLLPRSLVIVIDHPPIHVWARSLPSTWRAMTEGFGILTLTV